MNAPEFERFWAAWPRNQGRYSRKGGKAACLKVWTKNYNFTQADTIIKHVEWLKTTEAWLKDQGAYILAPLVYLNQQRWDGANIPDTFAPEDDTPAVQQTRQLLAAQAEHRGQALAVDEVRRRVDAIKQRLKGA